MKEWQVHVHMNDSLGCVLSADSTSCGCAVQSAYRLANPKLYQSTYGPAATKMHCSGSVAATSTANRPQRYQALMVNT